MKTQLLVGWESLAVLAAEWNFLLGQTSANTIFLTWEWIDAWKEVGGQERKPFVVVVRDSRGELIGLAPYHLGEMRLLRTISYRTLRPLADHGTGFEYPDWIVRPDREKNICEAIAAELSRTSSQWDCIWMRGMSGWTGAVERVLESCRASGFFCQSRPATFACMGLPGRVEELEKRFSRNRREQLRRQAKKIYERAITFERCERQEELPEYLDALFDLHARRWSLRGEKGTFRKKPEEAAFYRIFATTALSHGWLRMYALKDAGRIKAVQIGYAYNGVFNQMQEGFDPEYLDGVGNVLRMHVLRECVAEGLREYDFLGEMSEHKRRWLAEERTGKDVFIGKRSLKTRLLFHGKVWPTGRYLRPAPFVWKSGF